MKSLSVIVPVYNVEDYVEKCIRSLLEQDIPLEDYEIICINDGSTDSSLSILRRLQNEYENIIILDQENKGVSQARNNGLDHATGKYILFIDSDDYVEINSFKHILSKISKQKSEVMILAFSIINEKGEITEQVLNNNIPEEIYTGIEAYNLPRGVGLPDPDRIYAVLIETKLLNQKYLRFLPNVPYLEDGEFFTRVLSISQRCMFDNKPFYCRTIRMGSATNSRLFYSNYAHSGFLKSAENLTKFRDTEILSNEQKLFLNQPIIKFTLLPLMITSSLTRIKKFRRIKNEIIIKDLDQLELDGCNSIYAQFGKIFNKSISGFFFYWIIRKVLLSIKIRITINDFFLFGWIYEKMNLYDYFVIRKINN